MLKDSVLDAVSGDRRAIARLLSAIESEKVSITDVKSIIEEVNQVSESLDSDSWDSIAITGAPGVGKSCICDKLLTQWAELGMNVVLLAVDPSSPRSGGALLGDRIRLSVVDNEALKDKVFIRSVATRKTSGSVPFVLKDMVDFMLLIGWDKIIIETVGAGQADIRCAAVGDRIVVVEGPARGDGVQAEKAGLLELADCVLVNKSDLPGAKKHADEIKESLELADGEVPEVILVSALKNQGIEEMSNALLELKSSGRSDKAKWRERLLATHERKIMSNPEIESILERLSSGTMQLEEALEELD